MENIIEEPINDFIDLREMITNEIVSKAIYVAAKLKIADHLTNGPKSSKELADLTSSDSNKLYRVLRVLSSKGIFHENSNGKFEITEKGHLLKEGRKTLHSFSLMFGGGWNQNPFGGLLESVKTGKSAFKTTMGVDFFEYMENDECSSILFNNVMTDFLGGIHQAAVDAYDFSPYKKIVDIGGGHGSLMRLILDKHTHAHGVVLDTEAVVQGTTVNISQWVLEDRCSAVVGDFFEKISIGGDLFILSRVIHDWDDEECVKILTNCRVNMDKDSRLILIEQIMLNDNKPSFTKITDLWMLMMFDKGRERTRDEFEKLFQQAGLKINHIYNTNVNDSVIELIKIN